MFGLLMATAIQVVMSQTNDPSVTTYQACIQKVGGTAVCVAPSGGRAVHTFTNLLWDTEYDLWFTEDGVERVKTRHRTQKKTSPDVQVIVEKGVQI